MSKKLIALFTLVGVAALGCASPTQEEEPVAKVEPALREANAPWVYHVEACLGCGEHTVTAYDVVHYAYGFGPVVSMTQAALTVTHVDHHHMYVKDVTFIYCFYQDEPDARSGGPAVLWEQSGPHIYDGPSDMGILYPKSLGSSLGFPIPSGFKTIPINRFIDGHGNDPPTLVMEKNVSVGSGFGDSATGDILSFMFIGP